MVADKSRSSSSSASILKTPASSSASKAKQLFTTPASSGSSKGRPSLAGTTPMDVDEAGGSPAASELPEGTLQAGKHLHHKLDWLTKNRRDAQKRRPDEPDFDPRTLYVPPDYLKKETPAMRQWWEFKSKNFDTLLFFKVSLHVYT